MRKFIEWFLSPSVKTEFEDYLNIDNLYDRVAELEQKVSKLQEENLETTNELYRLENSLDARIDILSERCRINYDV